MSEINEINVGGTVYDVGGVSYKEQNPTAAQQQTARRNIQSPYWVENTESIQPTAGATLPVATVVVDDAEAGTPLSLTFNADNASSADNDGVYKLYKNVVSYNQLARSVASGNWAKVNHIASGYPTFSSGVMTVQTDGSASSASPASVRDTGGYYSTSQNNHKLLLIYDAKKNTSSSTSIRGVWSNSSTSTGYWFSSHSLTTSWVTYSDFLTAATFTSKQLLFTCNQINVEFQIRNVMLFDLTRMFGAGYEPTTASAFWEMMEQDGYGTNYQETSNYTDKAQYTFDFSGDPIPYGTTYQAVGDVDFALQRGGNKILQTAGTTTNNTITLTYPRDIGIVLDKLEAAIVVINSNN